MGVQPGTGHRPRLSTTGHLGAQKRYGFKLAQYALLMPLAGAYQVALQARFIRRVTRADLDPPQHWIPHVAGYLRACETGLGWGMCPDRMVDRQLAAGELVDMSRGRTVDIELYWQSWRLSIGWLDDFSAALKARAALFLD